MRMTRGIIFTIEAVVALLAISSVAYLNTATPETSEPARVLLTAQDAALVLGEKYARQPPGLGSLEDDKEFLEAAFPAYCFEIEAGIAKAGDCWGGGSVEAARIVWWQGIPQAIRVTVHYGTAGTTTTRP